MTRRDRDRRRYATDAASRARQRARQNQWERDRYANDPEHRAKRIAKAEQEQFLSRTWGLQSTF